MRAYELILVLKTTLKEDERKKLLTTVRDYLGKPEIVKEDDWGQKTLAYSIKKETSGHYTRLMLEMEAEIPSDFEKRLITNDGILRHLFLRREKSDKKTTAKTETPKVETSKTVAAKPARKAAPKPKTKAKTVKKEK